MSQRESLCSERRRELRPQRRPAARAHLLSSPPFCPYLTQCDDCRGFFYEGEPREGGWEVWDKGG